MHFDPHTIAANNSDRLDDGQPGDRLPSQARDSALTDPNLAAPELYLNQELAQLEFNFRVLAQAQDSAVPLLERLRYLCIVNSNLDEFFEVRVAILRHHVAFGDAIPGADGHAPSDVLSRIRDRALELVRDQYAVWNDTLLPKLEARRHPLSRSIALDTETATLAARLFPE